MTREEFLKACRAEDTRKTAWSACKRADWMLGLELYEAGSKKPKQSSVLQVLIDELLDESSEQKFDSKNAAEVFSQWLKNRDNIKDIRRLSHDMMTASSEAILAKRPPHGALAEAVAKTACVCEILDEPDGSINEACSYIAEAAICLARSRAMAAGVENPTGELGLMADRLRKSECDKP